MRTDASKFHKKNRKAQLLSRPPVSKQQAKERSSLLSPRIMTRVLSHSLSPPGHPPSGFSPTHHDTAWTVVFRLTSRWDCMKIWRIWLRYWYKGREQNPDHIQYILDTRNKRNVWVTLTVLLVEVTPGDVISLKDPIPRWLSTLAYQRDRIA